MRVVVASLFALALAALGPALAAEPASPKVPTIADPVVALELWRGARVGMTVVQVRSLFPASAAPAQSVILTGGEVDRLQLAGVELEGHAAVAHFFFKEAGLVSVELTLTDLEPARSARNVQLARAIAGGLTGRYGGGYDCGDRSLGDLTAYECKWLEAPLSVRLWYMDTAGQAPLFYVAYRQADDPGYNL